MAEQRSLQIVLVYPGPFSSLVVRVEHALDPLEQLVVDELFVSPRVLLARVRHDLDVVGLRRTLL